MDENHSLFSFRVIDIDTWQGAEYYTHYTASVPCTYSMTIKLDISALRREGIKTYPFLLYALSTIINRHEEFRTAYNSAGQLGIYSKMIPLYTVFNKETKTFSTIWTQHTETYTAFLNAYQQDIKQYGSATTLTGKPCIPENTFNVSMIPWISFDGFNLNLQKGYDYLLPIFTFGKYFQDHERWFIPLAVQVHHAVCDGFHLCQFLNELQEYICTIGNNGQ